MPLCVWREALGKLQVDLRHMFRTLLGGFSGGFGDGSETCLESRWKVRRAFGDGKLPLRLRNTLFVFKV